jgi:hypothetical protein
LPSTLAYGHNKFFVVTALFTDTLAITKFMWHQNIGVILNYVLKVTIKGYGVPESKITAIS